MIYYTVREGGTGPGRLIAKTMLLILMFNLLDPVEVLSSPIGELMTLCNQ